MKPRLSMYQEVGYTVLGERGSREEHPSAGLLVCSGVNGKNNLGALINMKAPSLLGFTSAQD